MIHILGTIPRRIAIAVSGGIDSMAALDFLRRKHNILVLHYNHGTEYAPHAEELVRNYCTKHEIDCLVGKNTKNMPTGVSPEAWWREQRYEFFDWATWGSELPIITAHHLDDVVENWIFTSLNGNPFLIPHRRDKYCRPFLTTRKSVFESWCKRKNVPYVKDPSNDDTKYRRNYIRHELMPHALEINAGIHKTLRKKVLDNHNKMR
jgi:tRNA(Ile)-lysidine synthase